MSTVYDASAIEVLTGLEPVRKRPGMYTDTRGRITSHRRWSTTASTRRWPAMQADRGHCHKDGSLQVERRRPRHAGRHASEGGSPGVELILTRLHAGGKFSNKNYQFSGGLHGVGVSVVNALSKHLEVLGAARRQGIQHRLCGRRQASELEAVGTVGKRNTGTTLRFWPDPKYFDSPSSRCRG